MSVRRPIVAGNWKLNLDHVEAVHLMSELAMRLRTMDVSPVDVAVVPPFTDLRSVSSVIDAEHLELVLGAQHVSEHDHGAFTGEISAAMLARLGVTVVLVGHSERRALFHMDDATVARTATAVVRAGLSPMLCVGETAAEREDGATEEVLARQLAAVLSGVEGVDAERLSVAYEPVWAIGTGTSATPEDAAAGCAHLRKLAEQHLGEGADRLRILYGGSVSPENAAGLVEPDDVDGLLVGSASITAASFAAVVGAVADCYRSSRRSPRR
jgi:triosephosphate isomerase (TIM)